MRANSSFALAFAITLVGSNAAAQSPPDLPEGHPPVTSPHGPPPSHGMMSQPGRPADDPSLRPGSVALLVRDAKGLPVAGVETFLEASRKAVGESDARTQHTARTNPAGLAQFESLPTTSDWTFRAIARHAGVDYPSPQFSLAPNAGKRLSLQVFEATSNIDGPPVGVQAAIAIQPHEDYLVVEQSYSYINLGSQTWIASDVTVPLPRDAEAFQGSDSSDLRASSPDSRSAHLQGFVRPGAVETTYRYHLPFASDGTANLTIPVPHRVAAIRVIVEDLNRVSVDVPGYPDPIRMRGEQGQRLWVTEVAAQAGDDQLRPVRISLRGLPTPGLGRWYAVIAALGIGALVVATNLRRSKSDAGTSLTRQAILERIAQLESARASGEIGPKTYERQRQQWVDALAQHLASQQPSKASDP